MKRINYDLGHSPTAETLDEGELEYNIKDKILYTMDRLGNREIISMGGDTLLNSIQRGGTYATLDENNNRIVNENIWGDTNVGVEQVYVDCHRVGNMATIAFDIMLRDFSQAYPTDDAFNFDYKLGEIAVIKGWFKGIISGRGIFNVEVSPGDSSYSTGRCYSSGNDIRFNMGETARGSTDMTATKAYVHGTMVLRVHD